MSDWEHRLRLPEDFDGRVRLFPLPELVVFPHAMQPLQIFEPRYCELLEESMASDQLITMATVAPGEPSSGYEPPPLEPIVCITKVLSRVATDDNRHNVLLLGAQRARILRELETQRSFRMAEVEVLPDVYPPSGAQARQALQNRLLEAFQGLIPAAGEVHKNLHQLMASQMMLGPITDIIAYTLQFDSRQKIPLLGETNVDRRAEVLADILETLVLQKLQSDPAAEDGFPPPFSDN
ncbi:LON peptidase substrate-binding domain-containing protein [Roseimaritima ulvae]|uniref:Lon protease n=1 Tax=Roseimaritima ulvae TaxID=980254 RepID=A0A5B9QJB8_9BACT|nr:LON peptidase substrate-binding domain-containing protein [Roseimaritima ulvae]QEG38994.1 Lon protease [Roseimaritima ulvae]